MPERLKNCWEVQGCGRERGGSRVAELGECVASRERLGHSCWAIAGTLCGGRVQGVFAEKTGACMLCPVFKAYHRIVGTEAKRVVEEFPDEQQRYTNLLMTRLKRGEGPGAKPGRAA